MVEQSSPCPALGDRFAAAIAAIDAVNGKDPRHVTMAEGRVPAELLYSRRMSEMLDRFKPEASEALRLAARAQHVERWQIPRADFPEGRAGYHRWRNALKERHAEVAGGILAACSYAPERIMRVQSLIRKQNLLQDAEAQALEDVACLVFLAHYLPEFASKHDDQKLVGILRRTWAKMSGAAQRAALKLALPEQSRALVERSLAPGPR